MRACRGFTLGEGQNNGDNTLTRYSLLTIHRGDEVTGHTQNRVKCSMCRCIPVINEQHNAIRIYMPFSGKTKWAWFAMIDSVCRRDVRSRCQSLSDKNTYSLCCLWCNAVQFRKLWYSVGRSQWLNTFQRLTHRLVLCVSSSTLRILIDWLSDCNENEKTCVTL